MVTYLGQVVPLNIVFCAIASILLKSLDFDIIWVLVSLGESFYFYRSSDACAFILKTELQSFLSLCVHRCVTLSSPCDAE